MATYAVQGPPHAGATVAMATPGGTTGDLAPTGQGIGLLVQNSGTASATVTLAVVPTYDGLAVTSRVVNLAVAVGTVDGITLIPLPSSVYGSGLTTVAYSTTTNIAVAVVTIP